MIRIEREIGSGDMAISRIVSDMIRLAKKDSTHPRVKALVKKLYTSDEIESIRGAFQHVIENIPYVPDPKGYELVTAPKHLLGIRPFGDCDCQTTLLASLLLGMGFRVAIRVISWDEKRCEQNFCPFTHVYLLVRTHAADGWVPLDPVMKQDGWGREKAIIIRRKDYEVK